jgi:hypothetical protein
MCRQSRCVSGEGLWCELDSGRIEGAGPSLWAVSPSPASSWHSPGWAGIGDEGPRSSGLSQHPSDKKSSGSRRSTLPVGARDPIQEFS